MALQYREVTGFFTARIPDSGDADLNPDTVPLTGHVTFRPEYRKPLVFPGEHIVLEPINAIIIDGQLMVEVIQGEDVVLQALYLPVTMDDAANQTWSWTMRFHGMTLGQYGETVELPDVRFVIEEGDGPLDLSTVPQTTAGASCNFITRGPRGYGVTEVSAANGELVFEWEDGRADTIPMPDSVPGPPPAVEWDGPRLVVEGERSPDLRGPNTMPADEAVEGMVLDPESLTSEALRENFLEGRADEDQVALGPELITSTGWSLGTGWSGDLAAGFTHATGNTAPLTWTPGFDPRSDGGYYMVQWTITSQQGAEQFNRADVDVHFGGGWAGVTYQMDGLVAVYSRAIRATTGDPLTFAPASVFPSRIHDISVRRIGEPVAPVSTWRDESGAPSVELRAGGLDNLFIGKSSGQRMADANNPGRYNVTVGHNAMQESASGFFNTAVGYDSLRDLINGTRNVGVGYNSLMDLTTGDRNVGLGSFALARITEGRRNVAIGADTLYQSERSNDNVTMGYLTQHAADDQQMTIAIGNLTMGRSEGSLRDIAIGERAMWYGGGEDNIAVGRFAARDTTSDRNVAIGSFSLWRNTGGHEQVAIGANAMRYWGTTSYENTAVGAGALLGTDGKSSGLGNTAIGNLAGRQLESGSQNTLIGRRAGQTMRNGSKNIVIGYSAEVTPAAGASNQLSIGNLIRGRLDTRRVGINVTNPLGSLHLPSWGATDNIPLVFAPGPLADDPRSGGMEFGPDGLFITLTNGTRHRILTEPA